MKLSQSERQTLLGPAVVGAIAGIFFVVCSVAFNSEYKPAVPSDWPTIIDAVVSFTAGFLLAFLPFGFAPVLIGRIRTGAGTRRR